MSGKLDAARRAVRTGLSHVDGCREERGRLVKKYVDYVPEGATRTGDAGTYATQENVRLMRAALDEVSAEVGVTSG